MGQPKELHEWQWSEDDPTTLRSSDITEISLDQYGSLLAPFENGFRITDGDDDEPRSSSAPPGRSRDASPRSPGAGLAQLAYKRLGVRLSPTTRSISDPPLPGGEIAGGAFDDMEDELARWQRGEDQKNSAEGGPTEDELAWLDMQCDALDRAAAEDAWVAQQTRTYPELHADEARWLFNACPPSPLLQRRAPPEVPEPCSMDEY
jgi:hypothetical protein